VFRGPQTKVADIPYHLKKKLLESKGGIDELRQQLSQAVTHRIDKDQVKEVARLMEQMCVK